MRGWMLNRPVGGLGDGVLTREKTLGRTKDTREMSYISGP